MQSRFWASLTRATTIVLTVAFLSEALLCASLHGVHRHEHDGDPQVAATAHHQHPDGCGYRRAAPCERTPDDSPQPNCPEPHDCDYCSGQHVAFSLRTAGRLEGLVLDAAVLAFAPCLGKPQPCRSHATGSARRERPRSPDDLRATVLLI